MHYFQFNIGDYASHTRHLSLMEDLAYRRLLDLYYLKDGDMYGDEAEVARQIGMRDEVAAVKQVLQDFFTIDEDRWSHGRCDAEITHFRQKSEKASNAGKASAQRRSNERSTDVQQTFNQPITNNQEPITNNQEDKSPKGDMSSGDDERVHNFANNDLQPSLQPEHVVEVWNAMAERTGLPRVRRLTDTRRKQLKARIRENTLDEWTEAIAAIERSDFCRGEKTSWRADFDFLLQPKSFTKLIEGAYDGRS